MSGETEGGGLAPAQSVASQMAAARRMWWVATGFLVLVFLIFLATLLWPDLWPGMAYVRAFCEAAMVGACADWFAVVALFRHPLGLPIPHTAIIPRRKARIGAAMGRFISENFLAPSVIEARLDRLDAAGLAARWLGDPHNQRGVVDQARHLVLPLLDAVGMDRLRTYAGAAFRHGVGSIDAGSLAARTLSVLTRQGYADHLFSAAVELAQDFVLQHQDDFRDQVARKGVRWLPGWVDNKLADAFIAEVTKELDAARAPDHPWRHKFQQEVTRWITLLSSDAETSARMDRVKSEVLSSSIIDGYVDWLAAETEAKVRADIANPDGLLATQLLQGLTAFAAYLDSDPKARDALNAFIRKWMQETLVPHRAEVGAFVADVVAGWDTRTLVEKVELEVSRDLQYIRLNGTLVGGMVGLIIFTLSRAFQP